MSTHLLYLTTLDTRAVIDMLICRHYVDKLCITSWHHVNVIMLLSTLCKYTCYTQLYYIHGLLSTCSYVNDQMSIKTSRHKTIWCPQKSTQRTCMKHDIWNQYSMAYIMYEHKSILYLPMHWWRQFHLVVDTVLTKSRGCRYCVDTYAIRNYTTY